MESEQPNLPDEQDEKTKAVVAALAAIWEARRRNDYALTIRLLDQYEANFVVPNLMAQCANWESARAQILLGDDPTVEPDHRVTRTLH